MGLMDLPNDILLKTLAASGCKTICMAATTCRRLRDMKTTLGEYSVFSSAIAQSAALDKAVADACNRALTGMLGAVDFALVFQSGVEPVTAAPRVLQLLQSNLPQGVVILGSSSAGLMGIDSSGSPFDLDPGSFVATDGVSHVALLLGCLPGSSIRTFATGQHPMPGYMDGLLTLAQEGLQAQLVILLATQPEGRNGAKSLIDLLAKLQPQGNGGMVVAGGIASGKDCLFLSSPQHAFAKTGVVALAICTPCQRPAQLAPPPPPAPPPQLGISAAALTLQGLEPVEHTTWSNFTADVTNARNVTLTGPDILAMWSAATDFRRCSLALWRVPHGMIVGASCMDAAAGGQPVVLLSGYSLSHGTRLVTMFEKHEGGIVQQVLALQPGTSLLAQLVVASSQGTRRVMRSELPKMRDFITANVTASRPVTGSLPGVGHLAWEGYEAVRCSAREAGARSGASALVLFSGKERGQLLHGATGVELSLLDQVVGGELPLVGMYCNSELGPCLRHGYAGWSVASSSRPSQSNASADKATELSAARVETPGTLPSHSNSGSTARVAAAAACAAGGGMPGVAADSSPGDHARSRTNTVSNVQNASEFMSFVSVFVALGAC